MPFTKDWILSQKAKRPIIERLASKIHKCESGCWNYTGRLDRCGYGVIKIAKRNLGAHKVMYLLIKGDFDQSKYEMMHDCHNRKCINPDHIKVGTHKQNMNYPETIRRIRESSAQSLIKIKRKSISASSPGKRKDKESGRKDLFIYNVIASKPGETMLFRSNSSAAREFGFSLGCISMAATGYMNRKTYKGLKWSYKGVVNLDGGKDQRIVKQVLSIDRACATRRRLPSSRIIGN